MSLELASIVEGKAVPARDTSLDEKMQYRITPVEFGRQLSQLARQAKEIKRLALEVGRRGTVVTKDGQTVNRKALDKLSKDYIKTLKSLQVNYREQGKKKPRSKLKKDGTPKRKGKGLSQGVVIAAPLKDFLANADYGPRTNEVRNLIAPLLAQNLLSRAILTPLTALWKKQNSFTVQEMKDGKPVPRSYVRADPLMKEKLGPYLQQVAAEVPGFSADQFVYNKLTKIMNKGIYPKAQLTAEYSQLIAQTQPEIDRIQVEVSAVNKAA